MKISKKHQAKAVADMPLEDMPKDEQDSSPRRDASATKEEENFLDNV